TTGSGTADTTPPTVTFTDPQSGVTNVNLDATISATFSEPMNDTTITTSTFTVSGITGTVTYGDDGTNTAFFHPSTNLSPSTTYTATITTAVKDLAGNAMVSIKTWSFSTVAPDYTPPTVISTYPANGATNVAVSTAITATFSESVNCSTLTTSSFTVYKGGAAVSGVVSCENSVATFTPTANLSNSKTFTATITTAVKDLAGNALASAKVWSFTTALAVPTPMGNYCQQPPFVSSSSGLKPNVLLIVDNSGSMYDFAYKDSGKGGDYDHPDTSYDSAKTYYGYFESGKMYSHNKYFYVDSSKTVDKTSFWYGNFLNWLTMRRVDVVRKVLVGGKCIPRSASTPNYLLAAEDPDRDYYKKYNGVRYKVDNGNVTNSNTGVDYNLKIYVGDNPPSDGIIIRMSDRIRFGIMFYNDGQRYEDALNNVRDGGYVQVDLGSTGTNLITEVENTDPETWTPLAETLYESTRYFQAIESAYNGGTYSGKDPIEYSCQKNFVLILTDGESTKDQNVPGTTFSSSKSKVTDSNFNVATWMDKIATLEGYSSQKSTSANSSDGTYYLEGVAYWAHTTDLRTATVGKSNLAGVQNLTLYTVFAFDDSSVGRDLLQKAAKYGGFNDFDGTGKPDKLAKWDTNGDGVPDTYFEAQQGGQLETTLEKAFNDILARVSSGTAASILSNSEGSGANLLQAVFYPVKYFDSGSQVSWIGEMQNLWYYLDPYLQNSTIREDSDQNYILELNKDKVVQFYFDASQGQTLVARMNDTDGDGSGDVLAGTVLPDEVQSLWKAGHLLWERTSARTIYAADPTKTDPTMVAFNTTDTVNGIQTKSDWYGYLQAADAIEAKKIIDYTNGVDQSGFRSRSATIGAKTHIWKLGDIISSTPKIQSNVRLNNYDLAPPTGYSDSSYSYYLKSSNYSSRGMVYVGANDGMLHAFKLGLLDVSGQTKYRKAELKGDSATFGQEAWAFIPKNALPYLKYLGDPLYNHIYYVDNTVSLFDASINSPTGCTSNYWECDKQTSFVKDTDGNDTTELDTAKTSWRTILIGGMGLGGASRNYSGSCSSSTECVKTPIDGVGYSSYFALDVTDPSSPKYMWEFNVDSPQVGTLGFATTGPAIIRVGDKNKNGRWLAVFGSGPTGPIDTTNLQFLGKSDQNLKLFIVDIATGTLVHTIDTGIAYAFAGSLSNSVIDTERGAGSNNPSFYQDNAVYIGYVQKDLSAGTWTKGGVLRLNTRENTEPNSGDPDKKWVVSKLIDGIGPVTTSVTKLQDRYNKALWLYFGTGRYFYKTDAPDNANVLYGVLEPCYTAANTIDKSCTSARKFSELKDQTTNPTSVLDTGTYKGWYITLDTPGTDDLFSAERVITDPVASASGAVFFTTFRPTSDVCGYGGNSYLWAMKYNSGSEPPSAAMQGKALLQVSTGSFAEISMSSMFTAKDNRRTTDAITGVPPKSQGLSLLTNPRPAKKVMQIQEK
ncbi:MAG: PilC/PilY family type IV pilus protein, partial [Geobacteraceae bacterium]|nr:PilC/PilY family type IV pilus protein [Geobacteraceae bacterium]